MDAMSAKVQLYILAVAMLLWTIPFVVLLSIWHDPLTQSMSGIGWRNGGMVLLVCYVVFSGIGMMYSAILFQKLLGKKSRRLMALMTLGCLLVVTGVFIPVRAHELGGINTFFHDRITQVGSAICVLAGLLMMSMLVRECRCHYKKMFMIIVAVAVLMTLGLVFLGFAAAAQVLASHLVLTAILAMCFVVRNRRQDCSLI